MAKYICVIEVRRLIFRYRIVAVKTSNKAEAVNIAKNIAEQELKEKYKVE